MVEHYLDSRNKTMRGINGGLEQNGGTKATIDFGYKIQETLLLEMARVPETPQVEKIVATRMSAIQKSCSRHPCHGIAWFILLQTHVKSWRN